MKRLAVVLTMLGFAVPALAEEVRAEAHAAVLSDNELDGVAAGHHHGHGCGLALAKGQLASPGTLTKTNINVSPIIVTQTAVAITQQNATNTGAGSITQNATTTALNLANINYSVKF